MRETPGRGTCRRIGIRWTRGGWPALAAALLGALGALLVALGATPALADRVTLKSGEAFTGTIVEEDAAKIVLKTLSGQVTIPKDTVKSVDRDAAGPAPGPSGPTTVTPVVIEPGKAAQALQDAKLALVAGEWAKAAGLLEGLLALDEKAFAIEDRLGASGALVTCYLQIKDAPAASRTLNRRASLTSDPSDKRRLQAAAEALRIVGSVDIGGKTLSRYDEVLDAAMTWKAEQILAEAKDLAVKAQRLNESAQLDRAAAMAMKKLEEADVYLPGYSAPRKKEPIAILMVNVLTMVQQAADLCEKQRPELARTLGTCLGSKPRAMQWNEGAKVYLARRQASDDALRNLPAFASKYAADDLLKTHQAAIKALAAKLDDLQYYPVGTDPYPYSYYTYTPRRINERLRIVLITFGAPG